MIGSCNIVLYYHLFIYLFILIKSTPKVIFFKSVPVHFEGTWIHVSWPNLMKIGRWKYPKSRVVLRPSPTPILSHLADRVENFPKFVAPWHVDILQIRSSDPVFFRSVKVNVKCLYCSTSHSRGSGTDHTALPAILHRTCLYLISIHQTANPQTEVADIELQPTTHLSNCIVSRIHIGLSCSLCNV